MCALVSNGLQGPRETLRNKQRQIQEERRRYGVNTFDWTSNTLPHRILVRVTVVPSELNATADSERSPQSISKMENEQERRALACSEICVR